MFIPNKAGILKVFFSWWQGQFDPPFIFEEELIQYQYNFRLLLNNLLKVG